MNNTEVALRVAKHLSDLGGIPMGFDTPIGIMITEISEGGFGAFVDCSDTFMYACGDYEIIQTEEELKLFLECSEIFVREYSNISLNGLTHWNILWTEEQDSEYCSWVTKLYCSRIRNFEMVPQYYDKMPEWLKPYFELKDK